MNFNKKKISLAMLFSVLLAWSCTQDQTNDGSIQGKAYARHVELHWERHDVESAEYRISVSTHNGEYVERTVTSDTLFLDFVTDLGTDQALNYRVEEISGESPIPVGEITLKTRNMSDEELLEMVQYYTFRYFWEGAEPNSGMAPERIHLDGVYPQNDADVVTTGGTGFGLYGILAGIERGWISREEGLQRFERIVNFLEEADRYNGIWPHWIHGKTGRVKPFSANDDGADLVESAFLIQGLLAVREYYKNGDERQQALAEKINQLWEEMEWNFHTKGGENVLYWHWSPNHEFRIQHPIRGYDECFITYVLAASSPTHPIDPAVFHEGWARGGGIRHQGESAYGFNLDFRHNGAETYGGPLFWAHYSYLGLDPRKLRDEYGNYWENNVNHTLINREWCVQNEHGYKGYGKDLWGLTASYSTAGYSAHHPQNDLGVITPTAALSSYPYTPKESMEVIKNLYYNYGEKVFGIYGFYDALSPEEDWYPQRYLAIDQGPIVAMIENHRTALGWNLFMGAPEVRQGLSRLGIQFE